MDIFEPENSVRAIGMKIAERYNAASAAPQESTDNTLEAPLEQESVESEDYQEPTDNVEYEDSPEDVFLELKADGKQHRLTRAEAEEYASKGIDYHNKTQALSERVRTEADKLTKERHAQLDNDIKRINEATTMFESYLQHPIATKAQLKELLENGEIETYHKLKFQEEERVEALTLAKNYREEALRIANAERDKVYKEYALKQREILVQKLPELGKKENQEALAKYLAKSGYSEDEIKGAADSRALLIAEKARRYDEMVKGKKPEPLRNNPPKVIKKVGSRIEKQSDANKAYSDAQARLKQSGSRDAAADAIRLRMQQQKRGQ